MIKPVTLFLSRHNLEVLLAKLDRTSAGDPSECTIIKADTTHSTHPQSHARISITAVENEVYYKDRLFGAGDMHPKENDIGY